MNETARIFSDYAEKEEIPVTSEQLEKFSLYADLLAEWNEKMNLTAVKTPDGVAAKHFLDSALLLKYAFIPDGAKLIDVGTGAGFPGVVLMILRPDLRVTLLDGLNKRLIFLGELLRALGFSAELVHARAEEAGRQKAYRQAFDFASARAVAAMPVLCEYCLPFLKTDGVFAAMKGPAAASELASASRAISLLGCSALPPVEYSLPAGDARTLLLVRRTAPLPAAYPRPSAQISRSPLSF